MAEKKKLKDENAPLALKVANDVYHGKMTYTEGYRWLETNCGFNGSSAADLINNFRYLMNGQSFERKLNRYYANYFLGQIYQMYGTAGLQNALDSLAQHVHYYEDISKSNMQAMREIMYRYSEIVGSGREDLLEQQIIGGEVKAALSTPGELLMRIQALETTEQEIVEWKGLSFKRKNWIIALIKELRDHRCQVCGIQIRTKSGGYYIEAAHITAKAAGGAETLDNILVLCPNHHKEFDWGEVEIKLRSKNSITIVLNGQTYPIML